MHVMDKLANVVNIEPKSGVTEFLVVWMHGLGACAEDFLPIVDRLGLAEDHSIRFVFPDAPKQAVTINDGMVMPAWYDIRQLDLTNQEDVEGIFNSERLILELIEEQGVPLDKVVLAGFSQGAALALHIGMHYERKFAGVIALSGYLPDITANAPLSDNKQTFPIFMAHGLFDPIVPLAVGQVAKDKLLEQSYPLAWQTYPMQHTIVDEEIVAIGEFLQQVLHL